LQQARAQEAVAIGAALPPEHEKTTQLPLQKETLEEDDIAALRAQSRLRKRLAERRTSRLPQPP
jgi:hypothetical protein